MEAPQRLPVRWVPAGAPCRKRSVLQWWRQRAGLFRPPEGAPAVAPRSGTARSRFSVV